MSEIKEFNQAIRTRHVARIQALRHLLATSAETAQTALLMAILSRDAPTLAAVWADDDALSLGLSAGQALAVASMARDRCPHDLERIWPAVLRDLEVAWATSGSRSLTDLNAGKALPERERDTLEALIETFASEQIATTLAVFPDEPWPHLRARQRHDALAHRPSSPSTFGRQRV